MANISSVEISKRVKGQNTCTCMETTNKLVRNATTYMTLQLVKPTF